LVIGIVSGVKHCDAPGANRSSSKPMLSEILAQKINDCLADVVDADDRCDVLDAMHQILELLWDTPRLRQDLKLRRRVNEALDAII
jgi:hypothetical protein